jgi:hypothetical protein
VSEIGTAGRVGALLGPSSWLLFAEQLAPGSPRAREVRDAKAAARRARETAATDVGLAVIARERQGDLAVTIGVAVGRRVTQVRRLAFLTGDLGRRRAANLACAELWTRLGPTRR